MSEFYTKIFINSDRRPTSLLDDLESRLGGHVDLGTLCVDSFEVDVRDNRDMPTTTDNKDDAFLSYAVTAEVVAVSDATKAHYLDFVGRVMHALHACGAEVVAASDWEHELPGGGKLP